MSYSNSVNGRLLCSLPAIQWCKIRPCAMDVHGVDLPGAFRLDTRFLHNQRADSNSVTGTMFSSFSAFQRCKVYAYVTDIHGVPFCYASAKNLICILKSSLPFSSSCAPGAS